MSAENCVYKKVGGDPYGDDWKTACGQRIRCEAPEEVGMSFAPLPNANGRLFCAYCGKRVEILKKE